MSGDDSIEYPCARCGTTNRIPARRRLDDPKCGKCGEKVFPREPVHGSDRTWKREVEDSPIPVLVDFRADWCGPCKMLAPVLEAVARERGGKLKVVEIDVDRNPMTAGRLGIRSVPTLLLFRGPLQIDAVTGALPKPALDARLDRWL
jgi:thioredoxin 2